jgi:hypothetical protein
VKPRNDLIVGASARAGPAYILTHALKEVLGLNHLKIVTGYGGIREIIGAVARGEISGCVMDLEDVMAVRPQWLGSAGIDVVAQLSPRNMAGVPVQAPRTDLLQSRGTSCGFRRSFARSGLFLSDSSRRTRIYSHSPNSLGSPERTYTVR